MTYNALFFGGPAHGKFFAMEEAAKIFNVNVLSKEALAEFKAGKPGAENYDRTEVVAYSLESNLLDQDDNVVALCYFPKGSDQSFIDGIMSLLTADPILLRDAITVRIAKDE